MAGQAEINDPHWRQRDQRYDDQDDHERALQQLADQLIRDECLQDISDGYARVV